MTALTMDAPKTLAGISLPAGLLRLIDREKENEVAEGLAARAATIRKRAELQAQREEQCGVLHRAQAAAVIAEEKARTKYEEATAARVGLDRQMTALSDRLSRTIEQAEREIRAGAPQVIGAARAEILKAYTEGRLKDPQSGSGIALPLTDVGVPERSLTSVLDYVERAGFGDDCFRGGLKRLRALAESLDVLDELELEPDIQVIEQRITEIQKALHQAVPLSR